jgi:hypothetical protein
MRQFLLRLTFACIQLAAFLPGQAKAADFCADPTRRWCLGTLAFEAHEVRAKVTQFSNDDILVELTDRERTERMLMREGESSPSYFGLTEDEQQRGGVALKFSADGWALPLGALALAFPEGPPSVPPSETEKPVDLGGVPLVVTAWRSPGGSIGFRIYTPNLAPPIVTGEFSSVRPAPLDKGTIAQWGPGVYVEPFVPLKPQADGK